MAYGYERDRDRDSFQDRYMKGRGTETAYGRVIKGKGLGKGQRQLLGQGNERDKDQKRDFIEQGYERERTREGTVQLMEQEYERERDRYSLWQRNIRGIGTITAFGIGMYTAFGIGISTRKGTERYHGLDILKAEGLGKGQQRHLFGQIYERQRGWERDRDSLLFRVMKGIGTRIFQFLTALKIF